MKRNDKAEEARRIAKKAERRRPHIDKYANRANTKNEEARRG